MGTKKIDKGIKRLFKLIKVLARCICSTWLCVTSVYSTGL